MLFGADAAGTADGLGGGAELGRTIGGAFDGGVEVLAAAVALGVTALSAAFGAGAEATLGAAAVGLSAAFAADEGAADALDAAPDFALSRSMNR